MYPTRVWKPSALVLRLLEQSPDACRCYYCDCALATRGDEVVIAPWGDVYVKPGLALPTADHKIPRSRGGSDDPENLVLACSSCNSQKGGKTPDEYLDWMRDKGFFESRESIEMIFGSGAFFDRALRAADVA